MTMRNIKQELFGASILETGKLWHDLPTVARALESIMGETSHALECQRTERYVRHGLRTWTPPSGMSLTGVPMPVREPFLVKLQAEPPIPFHHIMNCYSFYFGNGLGVADVDFKVALYWKPVELRYGSADWMFYKLRDTEATGTVTAGNTLDTLTLSDVVESHIEGELWCGLVWDTTPAPAAPDGVTTLTTPNTHGVYGVLNVWAFSLPAAIRGNGAAGGSDPYVEVTNVHYYLGTAYV